MINFLIRIVTDLEGIEELGTLGLELYIALHEQASQASSRRIVESQSGLKRIQETDLDFT